MSETKQNGWNDKIVNWGVHALMLVFGVWLGSYQQKNDEAVTLRDEQTSLELREVKTALQNLSAQVAELKTRQERQYTAEDARRDWGFHEQVTTDMKEKTKQNTQNIERLEQRYSEMDIRMFRLENNIKNGKTHED